ncbi:MAG: class I SAM-dependent methyltransferase, partial [Pirellulaceae bacterium]
MTTAPLTYGPIECCQVCGTRPLVPALSLGFLPPVNRMRALGSLADEEPWFPAEMLACPHCHLVQLGFAVDPNLLFPPDYPYTSGSTRILRENFAELYQEANRLLGLKPEDLVLDIGSNDGTLLSNFQQGGHRVVGVEPSLTAELALARGIPTMMSFFGSDAAARVRREQGPAKVVTAANVFAHIHGIHSIVDSIEHVLADDGVFISESHYLVDLVDTLQYDTIYHEHLRYYSLTSLQHLLAAHGLRVFHVKRIPTHGGSIRVYATKSAQYPADGTVAAVLADEARAGFDGEDWIAGFRRRVRQSKLDLYGILAGLKRQGARIYGVGAPSRASTLVNYVGLDDGILDCVLEQPTSKKINKYMPGTFIPVLSEERLYRDQPEYALLLSWHISEEL